MNQFASTTKSFTADKIEAIKDRNSEKVTAAIRAGAIYITEMVERQAADMMKGWGRKSGTEKTLRFAGAAFLYSVGAVAVFVIGLCALALRARPFCSSVGRFAVRTFSVARGAGTAVADGVFALVRATSPDKDLLVAIGAITSSGSTVLA